MKLIFDMDNTLIPIREEWFKGYVGVIRKSGFLANEELAVELFHAIGDYEVNTKKFNREKLLEFLNTKYHKNYNMELIDNLIDFVGNKWVNDDDKKISTILEELSANNELYVLSNWFTEAQRKRLEHLGLAKYFKKIMGGDMYATKPNHDAYDYFSDYENCVMIGDNPDVDLKGAKELGMKCVLVDPKGKYPNYAGIKIKHISELKNILEEL